MKYCSCWKEYPNEEHKFKNGHWKCVDKYQNIHPLEIVPIPGMPCPKYVHKTWCVKKGQYMNTTMTKNIIFYADMIQRILSDCEDVQNSGESSYAKQMAKVVAYDSILELVKGEKG